MLQLLLLLLLMLYLTVAVFWLGSLVKIVDNNYIKRDEICLFDNDSISWKLKGGHMLQLLLLLLPAPSYCCSGVLSKDKLTDLAVVAVCWCSIKTQILI